MWVVRGRYGCAQYVHDSIRVELVLLLSFIVFRFFFAPNKQLQRSICVQQYVVFDKKECVSVAARACFLWFQSYFQICHILISITRFCGMTEWHLSMSPCFEFNFLSSIHTPIHHTIQKTRCTHSTNVIRSKCKFSLPQFLCIEFV